MAASEFRIVPGGIHPLLLGMDREQITRMMDAREVLGFVVLPRLRLTLTGFHDADRDQLSVSAFEPGRWDRLESEMKQLRVQS